MLPCKNVLQTLLILAFSSLLTALASSCSDVRVGARTGANIPIKGLEVSGSVSNISTNLGFSGGLLLEHKIKNNIFLRLEPQFSTTSGNATLENLERGNLDTSYTSTKVLGVEPYIVLSKGMLSPSITQVDFPIQVSFHNTNPDEFLQPYFSTGVMLSYVLSYNAAMNSTSTYFTDSRTYTTEFSSESIYYDRSERRYFASLLFTAGTRFRISESFDIGVEARLQQSARAPAVSIHYVWPAGAGRLNYPSSTVYLPTTIVNVAASAVFKL